MKIEFNKNRIIKVAVYKVALRQNLRETKVNRS